MKQNNKIWVFVVSLLLANLAILLWLLFSPNQNFMPPTGVPPTRIRQIVGFDEKQKKAFDKLLDTHFEEIKPIRDSIQLLTDQCYDLIKAEPFKEVDLHQKIIALTKKIEQNEEKTKLHLRDIRNICTPQQRQIFDNEVLELFKKQARKPTTIPPK